MHRGRARRRGRGFQISEFGLNHARMKDGISSVRFLVRINHYVRKEKQISSVNSVLSRNWWRNTLNANELHELRLYSFARRLTNASSLRKSRIRRLFVNALQELVVEVARRQRVRHSVIGSYILV